MPSTTGFRFGRLPATHPIGYRTILHYAASLPDAPATFDHTDGFDGFDMLGNGPDPSLTVNGGNPVGDCAYVGTVNVELIDSVETHRPFTIPSSNEVVTDYLRYDHGQDLGCNLSQLLAYWHGVGLPWTGKLPAYAGLNDSDWDEFWAGVNAFGNGYIGIVVTETMMNQTQAQEPWDLTGLPSDDNVLGGHCVVSFAKSGDLGTVATWGLRQQFTERWFKKNVEEAHVALTPAQIAAKGNGYGLDVEKLQADLRTLAA
jgi:hypothetical protein